MPNQLISYIELEIPITERCYREDEPFLQHQLTEILDEIALELFDMDFRKKEEHEKLIALDDYYSGQNGHTRQIH